MKKQALTTTDIETLAPATSAGFDERGRPVSKDGGIYLSEQKTRRRATLRWFIDILALTGGAMAGVYVDTWLDSPDFDANPVDTQEKE